MYVHVHIGNRVMEREGGGEGGGVYGACSNSPYIGPVLTPGIEGPHSGL